MQKPIELDGTICRIAKNGDIFLVPMPRYPIYLLLSGVCLLNVILRENGLKIIGIAFVLVCSAVLLVLWLKQPKLSIFVGRDMIEWRRWFHNRHFLFVEVSQIELFFDHQSFDWLGHLVVHKISVNVSAQLEIVLKDGSRLFLGKISGEPTMERALPIAQSLAKVIKADVSSATNAS